MKASKFLRITLKGSVVCGVLGAVFALAISPAHADQMNDLCTILNTTRNNQAALQRQIENERNPLKQDSLRRQGNQIAEQGDASVKNFLEVNHGQFTNFTGVVSGFKSELYTGSRGAMLWITLPCKLVIHFQFIERTHPESGNLNPKDQTPLSKWRTALENIVEGDSVTFSGRFATPWDASFGRAVMTELRKKGGIAYKVPDEYILRENARREDELRKDKIIQDIASQLSGKWEGKWKLGGIGNPLATNEASFSLDLIRNGSVLTGTYYEKGGDSNISGSVDGKQISFEYQYADGSSRTFTGTINATGEISGKWSQKNGSGTWQMHKESSENAERRARQDKQDKQDKLDRALSDLLFSGSATLSAVQQLVANGASAEKALYAAIEGDRTDIAEFLIGKGADVNGGMEHESGPYIFHASSIKMLELLLAKGANLNLSSPFGWGGNWLTAAVRANGRGRSLAVIEFLLASGVSVTAKDVGGDTPLALARSQRESVVKEIAEEMAKAKSEYLQELEKDLEYRDAVIGLLLKYGAKD